MSQEVVGNPFLLLDGLLITNDICVLKLSFTFVVIELSFLNMRIM